ncbi:TPA: sugar kinase, partial [Candidatus Micrarchaeota archaeon]|nr:sugar kinase [Candidatus Micrarchaeota archaeon]
MITCTGSIALDTTRTREQTIERALGGAAAFFSYSASFFSPTRLVAVVGDDFPQAHWNLLKGKGIDLKGVERRGKTFFIDWNYSADGRERTTNCIELNCLADFKPSVPEEWRDSEIVYLGTIPPSQQLKMLDQMRAPKLALMDTIEYYIENDLSNLKKTIAAVDAVLVNDGEARKYSRQTELRKAAEAILDQGPRMVLIKKGS